MTELLSSQLCKQKEIIVDLCFKAHAFEGKRHNYFIKLVKRDISTILQLYFLSEAEKLDEGEMEYPYLKSCKKCNNKICMENVWSEVEREMSFEKGKINIKESYYELLTFC